MTFLCMITLRNKTVVHTSLPSFDYANDHLCQQRLLRSRNFATTVTRRHNCLMCGLLVIRLSMIALAIFTLFWAQLFEARLSMIALAIFILFWAQLFEARLALNPGCFFLCSKAFSRIIFSVVFRASNHQLVDKKN